MLKIHQDDPYKFKAQGDVRKLLDNTIGKHVFQISGTVPAANYISFPENIGRSSSDQQLSLTGHLVYVQLRVNPKDFFIFHIDILTKDDESIRVSFSNIYKEVKVCMS